MIGRAAASPRAAAGSAEVAGLQVLGRDGGWHDVSPYPPITVGDHVRAELAGSRAGVANPEAEREAARVLAALGGA